MRLYEDPRAPSPGRVRLFLAEKGIDVPSVPLDLNAEEHKRPEFLARNPFALVPVLELDDGTCIAETMAICRYVEALKPDPPLFGGDDARRQALVEMWNRHAEFQVLMPFFHLFRHTHPAMQKLERPQIPEWGAVNRNRVMQALDVMEARLAEVPWLAGDDFSVADITLYVAVRFMRVLRINPTEGRKALADWLQRMTARPAMSAWPPKKA